MSKKIELNETRARLDEQENELNETRARLEEQKVELQKTRSELEQLKLDSEVSHLATSPENCGEVVDLGIKTSRMVTLDPDGQNVKEEAFRAFCEVPVGRTILDEDVKVEAQKCDNIHCYEHNMTYSAPLTQIVELIESSGNCSQLISVECISAPFQFDDQVLFKWTDRYGASHPLTELGNSQCNLKASRSFVDEGKISNKTLLPILSWSYGPLQFEGDKLIVTIGSLVCDRKVREIDQKSLKAKVKDHDNKLFKIEKENRQMKDQFETDLVIQTEKLETKINVTEEYMRNDLEQKSDEAIHDLKTIIDSKETSIRSDFQTELSTTKTELKENVKDQKDHLRNEFLTKLNNTENSCKQKTHDLEAIIDSKETRIRSDLQTELSTTKTELQKKSKEVIENFETKMNLIHTGIKNDFQRDLNNSIDDLISAAGLQDKILAISSFICPTERTNSTTAFKFIEGKCYYITKGCQRGPTSGCTFPEAQKQCKTVFGSGISGKVFEPTSLQINDAVLEATKSVCSSCWYWIGVSNDDIKYISNGKSVSISIPSIPWKSGEPSKSRSQTQCVIARSGNLKWSTEWPCSKTSGYTICETSF